MNQQRSILRAGADNGLTLYLDKMESPADADAHRATVHGVAVEVLAFLQSGEVAEMTGGVVQSRLIDLVPVGHQQFLNQLLAAISGGHVDIDRQIGSENVKRLEAVCVGVIQGSTYYSLADRE